MSNAKLAEITQEIKKKLPLLTLFAEYFPDHYQQDGLSFCPFHDDRTPSLELKRDRAICYGACSADGRGKAYDVFHLYQKRYSCDFKTAKRALSEGCGISTEGQAKITGRITATYDYVDESDQLLFQVVRYQPKDFKQRRPDPDHPNKWIWKLANTRRVLFRLPAILKASPDKPILICEGEKDCLNAAKLGFIATTNAQGAGKWKAQVDKDNIHAPLKDRIVWVIPDNDQPGLQHAHQVATSLVGYSRLVKLLQLPGLEEKQDLSDFVQIHGLEKAKALLLELAEAAPAYEPRQAESATEEDTTSSGKESKFKRLLLAFQQTGSEVFLDQHNSGWACIKVNEHHENLPLHSTAFSRFLLRLYVGIYDDGIGKEAISQVADLLEATAKEKRALFNRFAWTNDALLIDMATPSWEGIRVNQSGWEIVQLQKSPFKRFNHQQPLPIPQKEGDVRKILEFLPLKDEKATLLLLVWIVAAFIENIPRPGIILHGLQGSGKSTVCEFLRDVIDPSSTPIVALSKDEPEFIQMMSHNAIVCLDNLHKLPQWASDDLCRAVTGSGFSKRQLYSDDDDVIYQFARTFVVNGIAVPGNSPDLMDRSILLELDRVKEENRRERGELCNGYKQARSRIFGGVLDTLAGAMGLRNSIKLNRLPRMADFTVWGCAIAEALGFGQTDFLEAYYSNINFQHEEITTSEPVCMALIEFFKDRADWQGTPSELYEYLKKNAESLGIDKSSRWPKAAHVLTRYLKQFNHNLAEIGIDIRAERDGRTRTLIIKNGQREAAPEKASQASERHTANDSGQLDMTHSMTQSDGYDNTVTTSVTHNVWEPLDNDASDSNDAICGSPQTSESQRYMTRLAAWGCPRCTHLDETPEYLLCRIDSDPLDLTSPEAYCRKSRPQFQARAS
jgi:DNA primase